LRIGSSVTRDGVLAKHGDFIDNGLADAFGGIDSFVGR